MEKNLLFYLLRAIAACSNKTYRKVDAPDDMVAVHVNVEFLFEKSEICFMERFIKGEMVEDGITKSALDMCKEMRKTIKNYKQ